MALTLDLPTGAEMRHRTYEFRARKEGDATRIAGYASVFGSLNSHGEVMVPGCWAETLKNRDAVRPVIMGFLHRTAIGKWSECGEDEHGLLLDGPVSDTTDGRDASVLARDGVLTGLSVGFFPREYEFAEAGQRVTFETPYGQRSFQFDEPVIYILRADLVEASLVMAPSDDEARVTEVRSILSAAAKALPALRDKEASFEDAAYSMALLMGGRGAAAFADLPDPEHRAVFNTICAAYVRHGKTAPDYTRQPKYDEVNFVEGERELFHDRHLGKQLRALVAGARGVSGPISAETREAAREAVETLSPLCTDPQAEEAAKLAQVRAQLLSITEFLKEGEVTHG